MGESLVVRSKIKSATELNVASEFAEALSEEVNRIIKKAEERAKANGRKTLKKCDI